MTLYSVSLNRTLILSAVVAVRAKNEEAAQTKAEEMIIMYPENWTGH